MTKRKIVIKIGTSSITHSNGNIYLKKLNHLVWQLVDLVNLGNEVVLVSSGAIAAGMRPLGFTQKPILLQDKQAAAAVGQGLLMNIYEKSFVEHGIPVGQVLLTKGDYLNPRHYIHARNTILRLLDLGAVPIVNENDTVSVDELKIGDNDTLSAMVASIIDADLLIILSDIEGLYTDNPMKNSEAKLIPVVEKLTPEIFKLAKGKGSDRGTGGMHTKLLAADICMNSGIDLIIASSQIEHVLLKIEEGNQIGTLFKAYDVHPQMKKRQLLFEGSLEGEIHVDDGCKDAIINSGSSLLPIGILRILGDFHEGDGVIVKHAGHEIARGFTNYDATELRAIIGLSSDTIAIQKSGKKKDFTAIHRDNLILKR